MPSNEKIALVTGSAQGIGEAIARSLHKKGAHIVLNGLPKDEPGLSSLAKEMGTEYVLADVSKEDDVRGLVSGIQQKYGALDILVSNAGINLDGLMKEANPEHWNKVIQVNLTAAFLLTREVLPKMIESKWGRIVYISSIIAKIGMRGTSYYSASKAGLLGLCKATACEVARKGITVNAVCPGYVDTDMIRNYPESWKEEISSKIPLGRLARPEEISETAAFLCQEEASYITGTSIDVCGGLL